MSKRLRSHRKGQQLHSIIDKLRGACKPESEDHSENEAMSLEETSTTLAENRSSLQTDQSLTTKAEMVRNSPSNDRHCEVDDDVNNKKETSVSSSSLNDRKDPEYSPDKVKTGKKVTRGKRSSRSTANTSEKKKQTFTCEYCGAVLSRSDLLKRHMLIHTDLKPYKCEQCGRFFRNKSGLQVHTRSHTGERPFSCTQCGKGFRKSSDLTRHGVVHTGARPIICSFCGRGFRDTFQLNIHTRSHTGEKPYKCGVCGKTFSRSDNMQEHERKHSGWKKYRCAICSRGYALRKSFNNHMKQHEQSQTKNLPKDDTSCVNEDTSS